MTVTAAGCLSRRQFLVKAALPLTLAVAGLPPREAQAALAERSLVLHHLHTGETLKAVYFADGRYVREGLDAITHHLRDWRVNKTQPVDPELVDLLWSVRRRLGTSAPVHVICGYRSPETNEMLRRRTRGVARNSLHLRGMAIDLRIPGTGLRRLRDAAVSLKGGGVGYYPRSEFVHLDTGAIRTW